eukprot:TRINITY_DN1168_c0_g2_i6.p1 TRINITY_DN1168_c0_g2~~TRINITY_DN1168_c0_g2_i6.p1  ORF type:complete len:191 (-),score=35.55 TRINITY_DN1168_c0_g2_i6:367-939(-)
MTSKKPTTRYSYLVTLTRNFFLKRIKEVHPDVNSSPDANDQFVRVKLAYDSLMNNMEGKTTNQRSPEQPYRPPPPRESYEEIKYKPPPQRKGVEKKEHLRKLAKKDMYEFIKQVIIGNLVCLFLWWIVDFYPHQSEIKKMYGDKYQSLMKEFELKEKIRQDDIDSYDWPEDTYWTRCRVWLDEVLSTKNK